MWARPYKRDRRRASGSRTGGRRSRRAMTLVELTVSVAVMSLVAVVLGGLISSVRTAREHVSGVQEATAQGRYVVRRLRDAVSRSGTYRIGAGPTVAGIAVVWTNASPVARPETLVVWTGGRDASLAGQSPLARLPKANELLIYTPDPAAPQRLVEVVVPTATDDVDFTAAGFTTRIGQLIASSAAEKVTICDRVRLGSTGSGSAAAVRFEFEGLPGDVELAATAVNTPAWAALPWATGSCSSTSGLRQIAVRIELQALTLSRSGSLDGPSLPVFGSAIRRYVYQKG